MPPRSALANISFTVDSASEDEMARDTLPTPDSNAENKAPGRKQRGRPARTAEPAPVPKPAAKGRAASRRASGGSILGVTKKNAAVAKKTSAKGGRRALAERETNVSDTEEVDEFEGEDEMAVEEPVKPARRGRPTKAKKAQAEEDEDMAEVAAPPKRGRKAAEPVPEAKVATKSRGAKRAAELEPEPAPRTTIPETQPDPEPMDVEESIEKIEEEEIPETMPPPPRPSARRAQRLPQAPRQTSTARRAGSMSDTERDPALRRKVGDLTKKLEAMTTKYENLKEVATSQRESNFEKLQRQTEQASKQQDTIIKSLKQQLEDMQSRSAELASMKKQLAKLQKENASLASENSNLATSLESAQKESKTLATKLAAARSSAPPDAKTVPGSAVKPRSTGVVLPGTAEAAKEAQLRQSKIDLYSDLTNLVIVGVKKGEDGEDVYDCLQTGRNGTLHFQLSIADDEGSYEDATFVYTPLIDEKRDAELLDLLPEYLTADIEFPRNQVARFYEKILESMTKKIELVD